MHSQSRIAREYASSPVEQAMLHTRIAFFFFKIGIITFSPKWRNASSSRKKEVTPMSRSLYSCARSSSVERR